MASTRLPKSGPMVASFDQRILPAALKTAMFAARGIMARNSCANGSSDAHTSLLASLETGAVIPTNIANARHGNHAPVGEMQNGYKVFSALLACTVVTGTL